MSFCDRCFAELPQRAQPLTRRQVEIFKYLESFITANGFAPSLHEIADQFRYNSLATVSEHLSNMERKGVIAREYNASRSILLLVRSDALGLAHTGSRGLGQ